MLGRNVHYYESSRAEPQAALITAVLCDNSDGCAAIVNLVVFGPLTGLPSPETSVYLHEGGETPGGAFCIWLPQIHEIPSPEI